MAQETQTQSQSWTVGPRLLRRKVTQESADSLVLQKQRRDLETLSYHFRKPDNTLSVKAYSETVTLPKTQGGEIFHAQGEATGNSVKEELITQKLASKTFPKCGLEKLHGSNFGRRGFYQLLG